MRAPSFFPNSGAYFNAPAPKTPGLPAGGRPLTLRQDRDPKFCPEFRRLIESPGIDNVRLSARSPNLNAVAERRVRTVKSEGLSKLILLGESSLRRALAEFVAHYHAECNHQRKDNKLLFPAPDQRIGSPEGPIRCKERLGGLLKHYYRKAA